MYQNADQKGQPMRTIVIWVTGMFASLCIGLFLGRLGGLIIEDQLFIGLGFVAAFICLRLWLGEKRG